MEGPGPGQNISSTTIANANMSALSSPSTSHSPTNPVKTTGYASQHRETHLLRTYLLLRSFFSFLFPFDLGGAGNDGRVEFQIGCMRSRAQVYCVLRTLLKFVEGGGDFNILFVVEGYVL